MIEQRGLHAASASSVANLDDERRACSSRCRSTAAAADALDAALDEVRDRFGPTAVTRGLARSAATPGSRCG